MLSPHKCQGDIDILLDDNFCSVTTFLWSISILEKYGFSPCFSLHAMMKPVSAEQRPWWTYSDGAKLSSPLPSPSNAEAKLLTEPSTSNWHSAPHIVIVLCEAGGSLSLSVFWRERLYFSLSFLMLCNTTEDQQLNVLHPNSIFAGGSLYKCSLIKQVLFN